MQIDDTAPLQGKTRTATLPWRDFQWILVISLVLLLLVWLEAGFLPLRIIRLVLGFAYLLYIPGYCLAAALFPRIDDLDPIERAGLSLGLSVAWVSILALVLDRLPWGLRLWPIALGEVASTLFFMGVAAWRRAHLPPGEVYAPDFSWRPGPWWRSLPQAEKRIYLVLLAALLLAGLSAAWVFLVPSPAEFMTEFYMLGPEGLAENFPRQAAPGELLSVTLGLANREREGRAYRVEVWVEDTWEGRREKVGESIPIRLERGETLEWPLAWSMPWEGQDQKVEFLLFTGDEPEPYRRLRLWLNVGD